MLRAIGNELWFNLAGIWLALGYAFAGLVMCITIIGIPFGIQAFRLSVLALWPFGRFVEPIGRASARQPGDQHRASRPNGPLRLVQPKCRRQATTRSLLRPERS